MKIVFLLIVIVVGIILFDVGKLFYFFSQTKKLENISQKDLEFGKGPELRYIAAGDSTAVGVGASSIENTYTYKVAEFLGIDNKVIHTNISVSGARTDDLIKNQIDKIEKFNPDIVTISIGANDITNLRNEETIYRNYQIIKDRLEKSTKATIYITNIPNLGNAKLLPLWFRKFIDKEAVKTNKSLKSLESKRFRIINIHDEIPHSPETFAKDFFHPSDLGYQNWTNIFLYNLVTQIIR
jgi:acyl-CoA thioesterase I